MECPDNITLQLFFSTHVLMLSFPVSHPPLLVPSHQGLNSMQMSLSGLYGDMASPIGEDVATQNLYLPIAAVGGELTDSFILLPFCSTILASQQLSCRSSTKETITCVPLDTSGRLPEKHTYNTYGVEHAQHRPHVVVFLLGYGSMMAKLTQFQI